jgi:cell division protein FtsW
MENKLMKVFRGDQAVWIILFILSLFSLLIVYSSTGSLAYRQMGGNTFFYLVKQFFLIGAGFLVIWLVTQYLPIKYLSALSPILLGIAVFFLMVAIVFRIGTQGSGRTISLGFISFQPAELAKIALILFVSRLLGNNQTNESKPDKKTFFWILGISSVVCLAITMVNFSTAALLFATVMTMMFIGRIPTRYMLLTIIAGIVMVGAIYLTASYAKIGRFNTVKGRIDRFIQGDPNSEVGMTQADYAKLAIYNGGQIGQGPGGSEVRNHMAAAYNDFIFAILIEEYGWFGFTVILLYLIFAARAGVIIRNTKRSFPAFMVTGLTLLIVYQAFINMGVSVGLLPVTGQPLPWVSMGGTSTLFTAFAFGCILRVSYQNSIEAESSAKSSKSEFDVSEEDLVFSENTIKR